MQETRGARLPVRAALKPDGLYFALRQVGPEELRDAFMQETVARVTGADAIVQIARDDIGKAGADTAPAGLIFHVARCGSTLVAQALKQQPGLVVYAEPLPLNEILLPPHAWPRHDLIGALRSLGDAFARHAGKSYVLKLTSWNTFFCEIVAEAFPATPWILCLRDPAEVLVSLLRQPAGWIWDDRGEPAAPFAKHVDPDGSSRSREEYVARIYGAFCEAASRLDSARGRLVRYGSLPAAVWECVAPHFGLVVDDAARQRMVEAARANAKSPVTKPAAFVEDSAAKQAAASTALRRAIDDLALPKLNRLMASRV